MPQGARETTTSWRRTISAVDDSQTQAPTFPGFARLLFIHWIWKQKLHVPTSCRLWLSCVEKSVSPEGTQVSVYCVCSLHWTAKVSRIYSYIRLKFFSCCRKSSFRHRNNFVSVCRLYMYMEIKQWVVASGVLVMQKEMQICRLPSWFCTQLFCSPYIS